MNSPSVSIVVLNWNGLADTIECLKSIMEITYPNYDVIVVDNGSGNNEVNHLKSNFIHTQIIANSVNLGFSGGNNVGIRKSLADKKDYVLILNNDTIVAPNFLTELMTVAEGDSKIGVVGPMLFYHDDHSKIQIPKLYSKVKGTPADVDTLSGAVFLVKRKVWEEVGLLDEVFYPAYSEDYDFLERVKRHGYRVVCVPTSKVYHKMGATTNRYPGLYFYLIVKHSFLVARRYKLRLLFQVTLIQFVAALKTRNSLSILMCCRGIVEGIIIFIKNPKARW